MKAATTGTPACSCSKPRFGWQPSSNLPPPSCKPPAPHELNELRSCALGMKEMGVRTSYYVPSHWLVPCAQDPIKNKAACTSLHADINTAMQSGMFTDLSFDFLGYPAMQKVEGAKKFRWNTWTVKPQDFRKFPRQDFNYIIMDTSTDPNTY